MRRERAMFVGGVLSGVLAVCVLLLVGCAMQGQRGSLQSLDLDHARQSPVSPRPFQRQLNRSLFRAGSAPLPIAAARGGESYPGEELWIIAKPVADAAGDRSVEDDEPGSGGLVTKLPGSETFVPVPLKHTSVHARIDAYLASVDVVQQFHNPFDRKIEAVYVFPLPDTAAISEFVMVIGERRIRGVIRDREQAERLYKRAREQGRVATLMTQERANIFTQKVANIEPGKRVDVSIRYFQTLGYADGWYQFEFPMVVGPRFNPPNTTHGIGAVARGQSGSSGQKTEVAYLRPNERSGHDISLSLLLNPGVEIDELTSVNHLVDQTVDEHGRVFIQLSERDRIPNKDFVLRYRVAGDRIKTNFLAHGDARGGGYFTLMLYPPAETAGLERQPMEMVFVIDASGSMTGRPLEQAKQAVVHGLEALRPTDTFQVIRFSQSSSAFGPRPVAATPSNVRKAIGYVKKLRSGGGTRMLEGIKAALEFEHDPQRLRFVCFLTDGYIGNERDILRVMRSGLGESRVFSFGIGASPNRYLMNRMAKLGRGVAAYLALDESAEDVMDAFFARVSHPVMRDIEIEWRGLRVTDVYPKVAPDLFVGRPVVLTGRYLPGSAGLATPVARVTGRQGGQTVQLEIPVEVNHAPSHPALEVVWARSKIADLADQLTLAAPGKQHELTAAIRQTALDYNLVSSYTSFIAVDASHTTGGDYGVTVQVPVPLPEGVQYESTVEKDGQAVEQ